MLFRSQDRVIATAFFDAGLVQQYKDKALYQANKGSTNANNSYILKGVGAGLKRADKDIIWSASIAWKLGSNPLYTAQGVGVNNDKRSNSAYLWAQVQWTF